MSKSVLFLTRDDNSEKFGGDTKQLQMYQHFMSKEGWKVEIASFSDRINKYYDYVFLVNVDRPSDFIINYNEIIKKIKYTYLFILPIHHSYNAINNFEKLGRRSGLLSGINFFGFSFFNREKIKSILRLLLNFSLKKALFYLPIMHKNWKSVVADIINISDGCFVLCNNEYKDLREDFDINDNLNFYSVPNGMDEININLVRDKKMIFDVCVVGRIEERKNQLNIIEAIKDLDIKAVFIGALNENNKKYTSIFMDEIRHSSKLTYAGPVGKLEVQNYYLQSKVHVSASWFEVLSLVDIEAYSAGCNVVVSKNGGSSEFIGAHAYVCEPGNIKDIQMKIQSAIKSYLPEDNILDKKFPSWKEVTKMLMLYIENK